MLRIPQLVLTGGPCGGKTSALAHLTEKLGEAGYYVFRVPEAATLLINAGLNSAHIGAYAFQGHILDLQLMLEDRIYAAALRMQDKFKPIVLKDRGLMDIEAYIEPPVFERLLIERDLKRIDLREGRNDAVFHLVTAASGAEDFYSITNNAARKEDLEEARRVDRRTQDAWLGHQHLVILENKNQRGEPISFEEKLQNLTHAVFKHLGIPEPLEIERKYVVVFDNHDDIALRYPGEIIKIEQFYVNPEDGFEETRFRKREQFGEAVYFETKKREIRPGVRVETERFVSAVEYEFAKRLQKAGSCVITKHRFCFLYKGRQYELDTFVEPNAGMELLEVELQHEDEQPEIPFFITVLKEVTKDPAYKNAVLAHAL